MAHGSSASVSGSESASFPICVRERDPPASVSYLPMAFPQWRSFDHAPKGLWNGLALTAPATWGLSPLSIYAVPGKDAFTAAAANSYSVLVISLRKW